MKLIEIIDKSSDFNQKDKKSIKENGVVFTDKIICDRIINLMKPKITDKICEPSVGKGSFIFSLLEYFRKDNNIEDLAEFVSNNLYCYDISKEFIEIFKVLLKEYFKYYNYNGHINYDNIKVEDFLLQNDKYDLVIGNPPYVRIQNLDKNYLNELRKELKSISLGNIDLYYAFMEKSLLNSKRVGFIIPNSFIKNKSGFFIRDIIKERVSYIFDFKNDKVWKNISTYTSIVICNENISKSVLYETGNNKIDKLKSELGLDNWIFESISEGDNKLSDMINYYSGGLATIKDDVFKVDYCDELFCYKNGIKIEKNICKKYIKGTTMKSFDVFKYIIYPYVNGKIIGENVLKFDFPLCYEYFKSRESELLSRDKGKVFKYDAWYSYGRRQGLLKQKKGVQIILPLTFLKSRGSHFIEVPSNEDCLVLSGILVDVKNNMLNKLMSIINSDHFYKYCELNNKILSDKGKPDDLWLSISATSIENYKY